MSEPKSAEEWAEEFKLLIGKATESEPLLMLKFIRRILASADLAQPVPEQANTAMCEAAPLAAAPSAPLADAFDTPENFTDMIRAGCSQFCTGTTHKGRDGVSLVHQHFMAA
jgi:hypothetical protein